MSDSPRIAVVGSTMIDLIAYGLGVGLDEVAAVTLGIACASDSVQRPGTQRSFPDRDRARSFLSRT